MRAHAAAIFLSAFLLFQVQPLAGKVLLPWYGGSAAVWSACLLFFQSALFAGYLYAHLVGTRLRSRAQAALHLALLALSLLALPVARGAGWEPGGEEQPVPRILGFLAATVGAPYLVLSANSPLLQRWYSLRSPGAPWRLYALSNLGSLLGLLSYPFVVEPHLALESQRSAWSALYLGFAAALVVCAWGLWRAAPPLPGRPAPATVAGSRPRLPRSALVAALAMTGALHMAATTHHLCQNVAVVPLLWVLPLGLYLASFIIVFADDRFYRRGPWLALMGLATAAAAWTLFAGFGIGLVARIAILSGQLFAACMVLHGELARLKPEPRGLTAYYLLLSGGGALGTAFVIFLAPAVFDGFWEYHVGLAAGWALALLAASLPGGAAGPAGPPARRVAAAVASVLVLVAALRWHTLVETAQTVRLERNFYGLLQVVERDAGDPARHRHELTNGGVVHGVQLTAPGGRGRPLSYYGERSGFVLGLEAARLRRRADGGDGALRIGCVGLGVGAIAAHTRPGDVLRYYEINPAVERVARESFTFLADAAGRVEVVLGDARLALERELAAGGPREYDLLVLDAFTGDAIPAHLLTREAVGLYLRHLRPGGHLLLHVSNRYLDLRPLVLGLAREHGCEGLIVENPPEGFATLDAVWADVSPPPAAFTPAQLAAAAKSRPPPARPPVVWTDEYSNLFGLLDRGAR